MYNKTIVCVYAQDLLCSLHSAYLATPTNLKIHHYLICLRSFYFLEHVSYMALVGSFSFNSFLSGVLSCTGTAFLAICLWIQVNKENKKFKDLAPKRAFADFVLSNLVFHLVIMNFFDRCPSPILSDVFMSCKNVI
ncbi:unnamed protein product [Brassica rapa subsp. trilocularis]